MLEEIWEKYQKQIIITGITVTIVVMFFSILVGAGRNDNAKSMIESSSTSSSRFIQSQSSMGVSAASSSSNPSVSRTPSVASKVMVDVKGAVKSPGVYEVKSGMRVVDAIEMAGGMTKSADRKNINLAMQLTDQQVVYIPLKGEIKDSDPSQLNSAATSGKSMTSGTASSANSTEQVVNINTATKEELLTLNGVGDKKADQIINYREQQGEFKTIEDLKQVQGIGDKIFEGLQDSITV
jgi:competence protein ComEA